MVKTYNCSCNKNMYLWWCCNVYKKRLQSFIWRYFYCAFLGSSLGMDRSVQPGVGKLGYHWLEWFARGQGIWRQVQVCSARKPSLVACWRFDYQRWHCFSTLENQGYQVDRVVVFLIIFEPDWFWAAVTYSNYFQMQQQKSPISTFRFIE